MNTNPLLGKVKLPGRVFNLPSKGMFYRPGEVLAENIKDGEIQVKPMSALAELKMRSADLLMSGKVLGEVCAECVPEILHPEKLVTKDVDALFAFLVISTYGSTKDIKSIHECENAKVHDYSVSLDPIVGDPHNQVLEHKDLIYSVEISTGQRVVLKPVTFTDSLELLSLRQEIGRIEMAGSQVSSALIEKMVINDLLCVIDAVEDESIQLRVTDRAMITEWLRELGSKDTTKIVEAANKTADWGFDFGVKIKCKDCGAEYRHGLELNPINFFSG